MTQSLPWPVNELIGWMPQWQAMSFFLATFILEDVATVAAGGLLAAGAVSWPLAFGACFLGIWLGDAGLYGLARVGGRTWFERSRWRRFRDRVAASERWFGQYGTCLLVFSRLIPGARLPTYLAAGFLRWPLAKFLWVTGAASLVWTILVLALVQALGTSMLQRVGQLDRSAWAILPLILAAVGLLQLLRYTLRNWDARRVSAWLGRWRHWEFWPAWMFYPPVAIYCLWLAVKYRGLTLPTAANPGIFSGGFVGESKVATLRELMATNPECTADGELISGSTPAERLAAFHEICRRRGMEFPMILKPDVGQRGAGVKLIRTPEQAAEYLRTTDAPLVVQRYAPGPHEAGVFYYRYPHSRRGHLFAITEKVFPFVTGDGQSTLEELVWRDPRARFMAGTYLQRMGARRSEVLPPGETLKLVEAGNHAQGCIFRDGRRLLTEALERRIDAISQQLPGFFVGRYDLRYASESDLRSGRGFQIIELNGAASEATSVYDARNSLWAAYRVLFRQWELVFAIGAANHQLGCATTPLPLIWKTWRQYCQTAATYPAAD